MTAPAVVAQALTKRFGAVCAVDAVSFEIAAGTTCGLLGGNGAGKTTTLGMLLGLLLPTSGRAWCLGVDMRRDRYRALARMNFSSPYVDLPQRLTVRENLTVYARLYGVRRPRERLRVLARELDLEALMDRDYRTLSAGQRTRVALAKALVNEPELLLLDEPTVSLDPDTADRLRGLLLAYQRDSGATIFMASHNMPEVERMCAQVLMMGAGRLVARGSPRELVARYGRSDLEQVFLDIAREPRRSPPARRAAS